MRIACTVCKTTHTHTHTHTTLSQYVIHTVFPLQQWLQERISLQEHCPCCSPLSQPKTSATLGSSNSRHSRWTAVQPINTAPVPGPTLPHFVWARRFPRTGTVSGGLILPPTVFFKFILCKRNKWNDVPHSSPSES